MTYIRRAVWPPAVLTVLLHVAFLVPVLQRVGYDLSSMGFVADKHRGETEFAAITHFHRGDGYDGQFYFLVSHNPFQSWEGHIDHPVRHLRVGYPLVCFALSAGGQPQALPVVMPLVNLLCIGGLTWLGAYWAKKHEQSPWWGVWLPLVTIALSPMLRNLTDPLGLTAALGLLIAWDERRLGWVIVCAAATLFTREQNIIVPAFIGIAALASREWKIAGGLLAVAAVWLAWVALLQHVYGMWPLLPTTGNLAAPFAGLEVWWDTQNSHNLMRFLRGSYAVFMLGQVVLLLIHVGRKRGRFGCIEAVGLTVLATALVAGPSIWEDWWSYTRNLMLLPMAVWMLNVQAGLRWALAFGMTSAVLVHGSMKVMQ